MVATLQIRQLQSDVKDSEEAELRRLEHGTRLGDDGEQGEAATVGPDGPHSDERADALGAEGQ